MERHLIRLRICRKDGNISSSSSHLNSNIRQENSFKGTMHNNGSLSSSRGNSRHNKFIKDSRIISSRDENIIILIFSFLIDLLDLIFESSWSISAERESEISRNVCRFKKELRQDLWF